MFLNLDIHIVFKLITVYFLFILLHKWFMALIFNVWKPNNCIITFKLWLMTVTNKNTTMASWFPSKWFPLQCPLPWCRKGLNDVPQFKSTSPCQHDVGCISKNYSMHNRRHLEIHCQQYVLPRQPQTLIIFSQQLKSVSQFFIKNLTIGLPAKMVWLQMNLQMPNPKPLQTILPLTHSNGEQVVLHLVVVPI